MVIPAGPGAGHAAAMSRGGVWLALMTSQWQTSHQLRPRWPLHGDPGSWCPCLPREEISRRPLVWAREGATGPALRRAPGLGAGIPAARGAGHVSVRAGMSRLVVLSTG